MVLAGLRAMGERLTVWLQKAYVILCLAFIFCPIITLIAFSFNVDRFPSLPWKGFSLAWYSAVFEDPTILDAFRNTLVVGASAAVVSTLLGFTAAYFDFRWNFPWKRIYLAIVVLPPTIPFLILGLALLLFLSRIGLGSSLTAVFVSHVVICTPFALAIIRMRLAEMDTGLEEAAWNLGAGEWRSVSEVILPFVAPAILASALITMAVSFDEFMIAWFVSGLDQTLPVKILLLLQGQVSPRINAIGTIVSLISFTLVAIAQIVIFLTRRNAE
jgi:spermidine/putrescine transport system permease protein